MNTTSIRHRRTRVRRQVQPRHAGHLHRQRFVLPPSRVYWLGLGLLCAAALLSFWLKALPFGSYISNALSLFGVLVHEMGHCLAAELVAGHCQQVEVLPSGGGQATYTYSGMTEAKAIVSAAGLLSPALLGYGIVSFSHFRSGGALLLVFIGFGITSFVFVSDDRFTTVAILASASIAILVAFLGQVMSQLFLYFISFQLHIEAFRDFDYMFTQSFIRGGKTMVSDSQSIANALGVGSYVEWGLVCAAVSVVFMILSARSIYKHYFGHI